MTAEALYWNYPTEIFTGVGVLNALPGMLVKMACRRIFVVSDKGLGALGISDQLMRKLADHGLLPDLYDDVTSNPTTTDVFKGVERFNAGDFDAIVALGGGSVLDAAKGIALVAKQADGLAAFDWNKAMSLYPTLSDFPHLGIVPLLMVPTTAGTGSELSREAVITDPNVGVKRVITHAELMAKIVFLDPELTTGLPASLTVATGMDALTHHIEALVSPLEHPMSTGVAMEGIRLINHYLPIVAKEPSNIEARTKMLVASAMAAVAFQKGLGGVHAIAHAVGARYHKHHGLVNAILLPYILAANAPAIGDPLARMAAMLDLPGRDIHAVLAWLLALRRDLGIPHALSDIGIDDNDADLIGDFAFADLSSTETNPIRFGRDLYADIFRQAVSGKMVIRQRTDPNRLAVDS